MIERKFIGEIPYGKFTYSVHWIPFTGIVWLSRSEDPNWGFTNIGQIQPVPEALAMETALEMLKYGGIS